MSWMMKNIQAELIQQRGTSGSNFGYSSLYSAEKYVVPELCSG